MIFKRILEESLKDWKKSSNRKPLIIRGARQVSKITLIRHCFALKLRLKPLQHVLLIPYLSGFAGNQSIKT